MTNEQLNTVLSMLPVVKGDDGWFKTERDQFLSLYAAHDGVPLTISRVETVKVEGHLIRANSHRGEQYVLVLEDLFALGSEAPSAAARKAGFGHE